MSYCIYLRKSRTDLEAELYGEGETLARHEHILLELAKKQKLVIDSVYKEIVSGETIAARPIMQKLLSEIEQGLWEGVLVVEVERLARGDTIDQGIVSQAFKYSNTKIITPVKTYDPNNEFDEEYFEFGLFMSRREYKTINRRLQRGRLESVKNGKYVGSIPPYGYKRIKLEKEKGYTLEIVEEEAEIVRLIFEMYSQKNQGVSLIVRKLNELQIKPRKSEAWVNSTIQDILKNPVYIGKIKWNSRPNSKKIIDGKIFNQRPRAKKEDIIIIDGLHKPIIDELIFNLTQKTLSNKIHTSTPLNAQVKNPLAGLVICGVCGRRMVRRPYTTNQPPTLMCPVTSCNNISSSLYLVEEKTIRSINEWLEKYEIEYKAEFNKAIGSNISNKKKSIDKLNEEINKITKQSDNLHNLLEQGIYDTDTFLQRSKILSKHMLEIQKSKENLIYETDLELNKSNIEKNIVPRFKKILGLYQNSDNPQHKNILLKEILIKIVYNKSVKGRWNNSPDDFEITMYPALPNN